jgi:hypothetical protein
VQQRQRLAAIALLLRFLVLSRPAPLGPAPPCPAPCRPLTQSPRLRAAAPPPPAAGTVHIFALGGGGLPDAAGGGAAAETLESAGSGGAARRGSGGAAAGAASSPPAAAAGGDAARGGGGGDDAAAAALLRERELRDASNAKSSLSFFRGFLPKYFSSEWSCAQFRVGEVKTLCAFGSEPYTIIGEFAPAPCARGPSVAPRPPPLCIVFRR